MLLIGFQVMVSRTQSPSMRVTLCHTLSSVLIWLDVTWLTTLWRCVKYEFKLDIHRSERPKGSHNHNLLWNRTYFHFFSFHFCNMNIVDEYLSKETLFISIQELPGPVPHSDIYNASFKIRYGFVFRSWQSVVIHSQPQLSVRSYVTSRRSSATSPSTSNR